MGPIESDAGVPAGSLRAIARAQGMNAFLVQGTFADLEHEIAQGRPVLVGVAKVRGGRSYPHYEVVVGTNRSKGAVLLADPSAFVSLKTLTLPSAIRMFAEPWWTANQSRVSCKKRMLSPPLISARPSASTTSAKSPQRSCSSPANHCSARSPTSTSTESTG